MPTLPPDVDAFVNLHPADLEDPLLYSPEAPLAAFSKRVVLEITERASVAHDKALTQHVAQLRALGYRIAVDDLGAGYAGLTTLARVQPEIVKLDGDLIRGLHVSPINQLVVSAVVDLSVDLGCRVVAEAIETEAELQKLTELGVELVQGFYFAKPARAFVHVDFAAAKAA